MGPGSTMEPSRLGHGLPPDPLSQGTYLLPWRSISPVAEKTCAQRSRFWMFGLNGPTTTARCARIIHFRPRVHPYFWPKKWRYSCQGSGKDLGLAGSNSFQQFSAYVHTGPQVGFLPAKLGGTNNQRKEHVISIVFQCGSDHFVSWFSCHKVDTTDTTDVRVGGQVPHEMLEGRHPNHSCVRSVASQEWVCSTGLAYALIITDYCLVSDLLVLMPLSNAALAMRGSCGWRSSGLVP